LIEDEQITEIMVNGTAHIFVEKEGRLLDSGYIFESAERLNDVAQQIASAGNRIVNETNPILDVPFPTFWYPSSKSALNVVFLLSFSYM